MLTGAQRALFTPAGGHVGFEPLHSAFLCHFAAKTK